MISSLNYWCCCIGGGRPQPSSSDPRLSQRVSSATSRYQYVVHPSSPSIHSQKIEINIATSLIFVGTLLHGQSISMMCVELGFFYFLLFNLCLILPGKPVQATVDDPKRRCPNISVAMKVCQYQKRPFSMAVISPFLFIFFFCCVLVRAVLLLKT